MNYSYFATLRLCASALNRARSALWIGIVVLVFMEAVSAEPPAPTLPSPFVTVDLNIGEGQTVTLTNGEKVRIGLNGIKEYRDNLRGAVRSSKVEVSWHFGLSQWIDFELGSGTYHLPV